MKNLFKKIFTKENANTLVDVLIFFTLIAAGILALIYLNPK
jgi:hypothetical protein